MSENKFLNALKEDMPEGFGRELLAQLKAEDKKKKVMPFPSAIWTVAAASIVTVMVGFALFFSRMPQAQPLQEPLFPREPITPENAGNLVPVLSLGNGFALTMALSPDNNTLAVGTSVGIYLHDAHDLTLPAHFLPFPQHMELALLEQFFLLDYSQDGALFLVVMSRELSIQVYKWDEEADAFADVYQQPTYGFLQKVDISPDGEQILITFCNSSSGGATLTPFVHCIAPGYVSWRIIDMASGEILHSAFPDNVSNAIVAINADWTQLLYQGDHQVRLFDLQTEEETVLLEIAEGRNEFLSYGEWYTDELHQLVFSSDGQQIGILRDAQNEGDAPFEFWEISDLLDDETPRLIAAYNQDFQEYTRPLLAFSQNQVLVSWQLGYKVFNQADASLVSTVESDMLPNTLITSSDGQRVYTLGDTGVLRIWSMADGSVLSINTDYSINRYPYSNEYFSISRDGNSFVNDATGGANGLPYLWNIGDAELEQTPLTGVEGHYSTIYSTVFSYDGRYLAFYQDNKVWLYEQETGERTLLYTIAMDNSLKTPYLAFREDGSLVMARTEDGTVEIFSFSPEMLETGNIPQPLASLVLQDLSVDDYDEITIPDSRLLLSPNGLYLAVFHCEAREPRDDFSNSCESVSLRLFNTATGQELRAMELELGDSTNHAVASARFSADSNWLAIDYCLSWQTGWGCVNGNHEFEFFSLEELLQTEHEPESLRIGGRFGNTWSFDFAAYADGSFLLTTTSEGYTRLWHIQANGEYEQIGGISSAMVTIAPDLSYIVGSDDGKIQLWAVSSGD
jgi:WD40 repeat protein